MHVLLQYQSKSYYIIGQEVYYSIGQEVYYSIGRFYYIIGRFYYIIGQLLQYGAFITLSVGTTPIAGVCVGRSGNLYGCVVLQRWTE